MEADGASVMDEVEPSLASSSESRVGSYIEPRTEYVRFMMRGVSVERNGNNELDSVQVGELAVASPSLTRRRWPRATTVIGVPRRLTGGEVR